MRLLMMLALCAAAPKARADVDPWRLDTEAVLRVVQLSRGGLAYYRHIAGTPYDQGPGPNVGGRATITRRLASSWSAGLAFTGVWGYLKPTADDGIEAYTQQIGVVARWTLLEVGPPDDPASAALRGELGTAVIDARSGGASVDGARRPYGSLALEGRWRVAGRVSFSASVGTTQPLDRTTRVVPDIPWGKRMRRTTPAGQLEYQVVPQLPLGGLDVLIGVAVEL